MASGHQQVAGNVPGLENLSPDNAVHGFSVQDDILKICQDIVARGKTEQNNIPTGAGGGNRRIQGLIAPGHFKGHINTFAEALLSNFFGDFMVRCGAGRFCRI